jgi:uncharacterized protein (DUF2267 family)
MSDTGLKVFDHTLHETNEGLQSLMYEMAWEDRRLASKGLCAMLQALRDRLTPEEAAHLGAQLPMLVRGFYYEGWNPSKAPEKIRDKHTFFNKVKDKLDGEAVAAREIDPETLSRAVFKLLRHRISEGEASDIESELPKELVDLWPHDPRESGQ